MKILSGHYSPETAYLVDDYPYGFRLRCKIRYWLEVNKNGTRLWSQTTNPKKPGEVWNKPKASTYSMVGAMFLDENDHVHWSGLSLYDLSKAKAYLDTYRDGLKPEQVDLVTKLIVVHEKREAAKNTPINQE